MMYEGFANVYDHMMNHIPYETWFENLLQYLHEKSVLNGRMRYRRNDGEICGCRI